MNNLPVQTSDIDLPPGVIRYRRQSYRNRTVSEHLPVVRESLPKGYDNRYMCLATDYGFKKILANPANKGPMKHLLNCMFEGQKDIADIIFQPTEQLGSTPESKTAIYDVLCISDQGEYFLVEMQQAQEECFKDRSYFYSSRMIEGQLPKGKKIKFCDIRESYFIGILDFVLPDSPAEDYLHDIGSVYLSNHRLFYPKQRFKFIELPKFTKTLDELKTGLDKWLHLMKHLKDMNSIPPGFEEPVFQEVFHIAEQKNLNKGEIDMYRTSVDDKLDQKEMIRYAAVEAEERGIERGRIEAEQSKDLTFVRSLIRNTDFDDEKIADVAAVDVAFVRKVQAKMRAGAGMS